MDTTTETVYVGWHRPSSRYPWRPVLEAGSEDEAWRRLIADPPGGDKCVLPVDEDPNQKSRKHL